MGKAGASDGRSSGRAGKLVWLAVTVAVFAVVCVGVLGVGMLASDQVGAPQPIAADSPCPATACADGRCHGYDNVPEPDGVTLMECPEAACASEECHGWDVLVDRYHKASDASLNLWILLPVVLVVGLVIIMKQVR